jgi:hypothetical protein
MKLSDLMLMVRDEVRDSAGSLYTDAIIARAVNNAQRKAFRLRAQEDRAFYNLDIALTALRARQVHSDVFRWSLPFYTWRVVAVYESASSSTTRGSLVEPAQSLEHVGWNLYAGRELEVRGIYTAAPALSVQILKEPAPLSKGTLPDQTGITGDDLRLASYSSLTDFPMPPEVDRYANSIIEITGAVNDAATGQIRKISGYRPNSVTSVRYPEITVVDGWESIPASGQTYDMHAETDESATDLLVLEAAHDVYRGGGAVGPAELVRQKIQQVELEYRQSVTPMDDHGMHAWGSLAPSGFRRSDPDRSPRY